jgi:effector-binding domain-containing protein
MTTTPSITALPAVAAAAIHLHIPRDTMQQHVGPACKELYGTLATQALEPSGPLVFYYMRMPDTHFDFELAVPVLGAVKATGRVRGIQLPAADRAATSLYTGPYEGLPQAWRALVQWIRAAGHPAAVHFFERYPVGPETGLPASQWRTELCQPLV